jgi:hypothetical protein
MENKVTEGTLEAPLPLVFRLLMFFVQDTANTKQGASRMINFFIVVFFRI